MLCVLVVTYFFVTSRYLEQFSNQVVGGTFEERIAKTLTNSSFTNLSSSTSLPVTTTVLMSTKTPIVMTTQFPTTAPIEGTPSFATSSSSQYSNTSIRNDYGDMDHNNNGNFPAPSNIPKHLRIMLIGDSITRFSYLSLAYFLKHGEWEEPFPKEEKDGVVKMPRMAARNSFHSWKDLIHKTTDILAPYDFCDCYPYKTHVYEARYFYDPQLDNFLVYIPKFGEFRARGHYAPESFPNVHPMNNRTTFTSSPRAKTVNFTTEGLNLNPNDWKQWKIDWSGVPDYIMRFPPYFRPTHLLFNSGLWDNDKEMRDPIHREAIVRGLKSISNLTKIYRTTNFGRGPGPPAFYNVTLRPHEEYICQHVDHCFDMRWSRNIPYSYWRDQLHFLEPIYRWVNEDLLMLVTRDEDEPYKPSSTKGIPTPVHSWTVLKNQTDARRRDECWNKLKNETLFATTTHPKLRRNLRRNRGGPKYYYPKPESMNPELPGISLDPCDWMFYD
jgi:hypothetical protein